MLMSCNQPTQECGHDPMIHLIGSVFEKNTNGLTCLNKDVKLMMSSNFKQENKQWWDSCTCKCVSRNRCLPNQDCQRSPPQVRYEHWTIFTAISFLGVHPLWVRIVQLCWTWTFSVQFKVTHIALHMSLTPHCILHMFFPKISQALTCITSKNTCCVRQWRCTSYVWRTAEKDSPAFQVIPSFSELTL